MTASTPHDSDAVSARARALFDAQVEAIDAPTATALRARRRDALAEHHARRGAAWWWPASSVATAALVVALWLPRGDGVAVEGGGPSGADVRQPIAAQASPPSALNDASAAADLADSAMIELENDADFYAWLATVPTDADTTSQPPAGSPEGWTL